jgi:hypothetical protein
MRLSCTKNCTVRGTCEAFMPSEDAMFHRIPIDWIFQRIVLFGSREGALRIEPFGHFLSIIFSDF